MLLLGIDVGTSSVKATVMDVSSRKVLASARYPDIESAITVRQIGWAEQPAAMWWEHVQQAILKLHATGLYNPKEIVAIGIAYQMHGLVCIDKEFKVLRDSIIWCDSRAVEIGDEAFVSIGKEKCLAHLLNSPGNFTASKLAWVKQHEPAIYEKIHKVMLPGDYISLQLTGTLTTSVAALSEGIFWDFKYNELSKDVFAYYGIETSFIPNILPVFGEHGRLTAAVAASLSLTEGTPVTYKAGDQPNNALSLNVLREGEVAATAGTSGVIYAVTNKLLADKDSRVNTFAHVNYTPQQQWLGVLLNINGAGILNSWMKRITGNVHSYDNINAQAEQIKPGSEGIHILPFGNGAERMLANKTLNAHISGLNFNIHDTAHLYRAVQEGIAFSFRYGLDILRENELFPTVIKAGQTNMFLSNVFTTAFVNATNTPVELYNCDGSTGAAIGAGIGRGAFRDGDEAFEGLVPLTLIEPAYNTIYNELYENWKLTLINQLNK